ncbi:MAG TPA: AAA family ATPase [Thermoanaerobaculia bacterium]|nr:AAA family ATPase [Thermoanaerobaculia bacterium]
MHELWQAIAAGASPDFDALAEALVDSIGLVARFGATPQDADWHAEGDVREHTQRVLAATYEELAAGGAAVGAERRLALVLAAVLHDVGKPLVTREREIDCRMRMVSPAHADRGRSYLALKLSALELPAAVTREVLALVGLHHEPRFLVLKSRPAREYLRLARLADLDLLYHLCRADMRGRVCPDLRSQLDQIELFRLFAEDYGAWGNRHPYRDVERQIDGELASGSPRFRRLAVCSAIRDLENGTISTPEEAIARSYRYRDGFSHLVVLCGPSGSGKSTWVGAHGSDATVIALDEIRTQLSGRRGVQSDNGRVVHQARDLLKEALRRHRDVIWDATCLRRGHRAALLGLGFDYRALVTLVAFQVAEPELVARNRTRAHPVPARVLEDQIRAFDWPYLDEAHEVNVVED